jgi:uncharacterized RDD family membrane protein YckC
MSGPLSDLPTTPFVEVPSFGGYAGQPAGLNGVGFWPRVAARVIDMIVHFFTSFGAGILFTILLVVASGGHLSPLVIAKLRHTGVGGVVFALLGSFAYHVVCTSVHGSTLGKLALSLVVVHEDRAPCRVGAAVIREVGYFVDALFFGLIGYMAMQKSPQEQRHGDEWAHTVVCKRSSLPQDVLRGGGQFVLAFMFALMADAVLLMTGLLLHHLSV